MGKLRKAQLREVAEAVDRKLLQSSGRGGKDGFVSAKHVNGKRRCKLHPRTATACRLLLALTSGVASVLGRSARVVYAQAIQFHAPCNRRL